jgi:hypothetical protein
VQPITFNVAVKLYAFDRALWGYAATNATGTTTTIRVDGTSSTNYDAQPGDEVTILEGTNAGAIRHITVIANNGATNETWTLDSALANASQNNCHMNVQPFRLLEKKTPSAASKLSNLYFDCKNRITGKKFLVKVVIDGMTGAQPEMHDPVFVYDDKGLKA